MRSLNYEESCCNLSVSFVRFVVVYGMKYGMDESRIFVSTEPAN
jgi:hypothetical protein